MTILRRLAAHGKASGLRKKILIPLLCLILLIAGYRVVNWRSKPANVTHRQHTDASSEEALDTAVQALYQGADLGSCRGAVQQINVYLSRKAEGKPQELTDAEREYLKASFELNADELAEVNSNVFTPLDAHYLDECFLFRDAARALDLQKLPPRARAEAAFAWVVRQVRLDDHDDDLLPPHFVVRRGWGSDHERALVFLALLKQAGMDGCMLAYSQAVHGRSVLRYWIPAALIERDLLVFDTRLGLALPGPQGMDTATLAQLRAPTEFGGLGFLGAPPLAMATMAATAAVTDILGSLTLDDRYPYDVSGQQLRRAEIRIVCELSALAPRMKYLEHQLTSSNRVHLATDSRALVEKFERVTRGQDIPVGIWAKPTQVLRRFLPAEGDGGADQPHVVPLQLIPGLVNPRDDLQRPFYRKKLHEMELTPWGAMPQLVRDLPANSNPGQRLRLTYSNLFVRFPVPEPPRDATSQAAGSAGATESGHEASHSAWPERFLYFFVFSPGLLDPTGDFLPYCLAPGSPRDQVLRGRFREASRQLVETLNQIRFQESVAQAEADRDRKLAAWCEQARSAHAALERAQHAVARQGQQAQPELEQAQAEVGAVWLGVQNRISPASSKTDEDTGTQPPGSVELPIWLVALLGAAGPPMRYEATYQLALCKQEQAEHGQPGAGPKDWTAAAMLWDKYLQSDQSSPRAAAARAMQARALEALGQTGAARSALLNPRGLTNLEKTGRLYQVQRLHRQEAKAAK